MQSDDLAYHAQPLWRRAKVLKVSRGSIYCQARSQIRISARRDRWIDSICTTPLPSRLMLRSYALTGYSSQSPIYRALMCNINIRVLLARPNNFEKTPDRQFYSYLLRHLSIAFCLEGAVDHCSTPAVFNP